MPKFNNRKSEERELIIVFDEFSSNRLTTSSLLAINLEKELKSTSAKMTLYVNHFVNRNQLISQHANRKLI